MMYMYSAVDYEVIRRIKDLSGRFYHSMTPDVYSGFAVAGCVESYVHSQRSYAIAGCSRHSIGRSATGNCLTMPAQTFLNEDNLPYHSALVNSLSIRAYIIEGFLQARDHLPFFQDFTVNMQGLLFKMMEEAASRPQNTYMGIKGAVLGIGQMHNISEVAQRAIKANPYGGPGYRRKLTVGNLAKGALQMARLFAADLRNGCLHLDCSSLNVKNIYDASLLCDHILGLKI